MAENIFLSSLLSIGLLVLAAKYCDESAPKWIIETIGVAIIVTLLAWFISGLIVIWS